MALLPLIPIYGQTEGGTHAPETRFVSVKVKIYIDYRRTGGTDKYLQDFR